MIVNELTLVEILAIVADMQIVAAADRQRANALVAAGLHDRAYDALSNAVVNEHWAQRLAKAVS